MRSERILLEERILHKAVLNVPKKPIVFVTDKSMAEACDNDSWYQSAYVMSLFEKVRTVYNTDGSVRGAWIYA